MQLQSRFLSRSVFAALWVGCFALILTGCDSSGSSDSDDGSFEVTVENVGEVTPILKSGAFTPNDVVNDNNNIPPLEPGEEFEFTFTAGPNELPNTGVAFSFASMFVQSNDIYYATDPGGVPLFDNNGDPIGKSSPKVIDDANIGLYDAGTEVDQKPGDSNSDNQAPRQSAFDQGTDENGTITELTDTDSDGLLEDNTENENSTHEYPAINDAVEVTVSSTDDATSGGVKFTINLENKADETSTNVNGAPIVLSPGTFAVHFDQTPGGDEVTFPGHSPGDAATNGIERIAEDGAPSGGDPGVPGSHVAELDQRTGVTVPISPGAVAVHSDDVSLFSLGESARPGIEAIAEDGRPNGRLDSDNSDPAGNLVASLTDTDGVKSIDAFGSGPLIPGNSVTFSVDAEEGDRLSLAAMFAQSNDIFYALPAEGIALHDENGDPISGDITDQVSLYDAGTEADQEIGIGLDQAPRQSSLNTGPSGEGSIEQLTGSKTGFSFSAAENIKVTITP